MDCPHKDKIQEFVAQVAKEVQKNPSTTAYKAPLVNRLKKIYPQQFLDKKERAATAQSSQKSSSGKAQDESSSSKKKVSFEKEDDTRKSNSSSAAAAISPMGGGSDFGFPLRADAVVYLDDSEYLLNVPRCALGHLTRRFQLVK